MKKIILIIGLLAIGGVVVIYQIKRPKTTTDANATTAHKITAQVTRADVDFVISAAGDIGPAEQVSVRPEINGRIETLLVDIGDRAKKGQILFTLEDKDLQTEKASRVTEIQGAELQVERAKRNFQRSQQLFQEKLISLEVFEDTKTDYELSKNALERAQKALSQVDEKLTKTKILAPFDCTVLTRSLSVGQAVSGSGGFNSGTEVLTIANLNEMIINAHINQADVTRLKLGKEVDIEVEAVSGLRLKGAIERIAPQATLKNGIKGFATRILLTSVDNRVRPGMTANLTIPVASVNRVLTVPLAAVFSEEGNRFVYIKQGEKYLQRTVQIGIADYMNVEIQSGVTEGETVALEQPASELIMMETKNLKDVSVVGKETVTINSNMIMNASKSNQSNVSTVKQ